MVPPPALYRFHHIPILLLFDLHHLCAPPPKPNLGLTDWPQVDNTHKSLKVPPLPPFPTSQSLEVWFDTTLIRISATQVLHTPLKRITHRLKLWGSTALSALHKCYNSRLRVSKKDCHNSSLLLSARATCCSYFQVIKKPKRNHLCVFLAMATPQTVLTANKFALGRSPPRFPELPWVSTPLELNTARIDHFFPGSSVDDTLTILLPYRDTMVWEVSEIERALAHSLPLSAPGPDMSPNSVCKRSNTMAPNLILDLLAPLVFHCFHSLSLKKAEGIVLDKRRKPAYDCPSSFTGPPALLQISRKDYQWSPLRCDTCNGPSQLRPVRIPGRVVCGGGVQHPDT